MKKVGDEIKLKKQTVKVVQCEKCGAHMVNIDRQEIGLGDLFMLRYFGLMISNPDTKDPVCLNCEIERENYEHIFKRNVNDYLKKPHKEEDDDSSFFNYTTPISHSSHSNSPSYSSPSFDGGFSGFGGGSFSGGGASGGF